ncbi:MAG: outer membrane beta-barrel protein [Gemmatimonadetes bacterium]|nr:porin family protein [Gemmatimonadota bacterium]NIR78544.1 porin family protein [Gemmatimonadota bacterium]NIT86809.1 porin family protein [Gemmatimonadota bacterium]NIU30998.1 porin family protein [Gemmatimonadota bacterium]NIU35752.1 outer membrane beta-barrel protein [Gemmatimonadota bacterium]
MKKIGVAITASSVLHLLLWSPAESQQGWAVELRGNGAVPTREIGDDDLGAGFGFEGTVRYAFLPHLAAYAGWDWTRFSPDDSFAGSGMDFEETGYAFGLRFEHPFSGDLGAADTWAWWARAGGTFDHLEIEDPDGELIADTGSGVGWEVGTGLALALATGWSLTPGVRYRSLTRDVEIATTTTTVELEYVAFEVGIVRLF